MSSVPATAASKSTSGRPDPARLAAALLFFLSACAPGGPRARVDAPARARVRAADRLDAEALRARFVAAESEGDAALAFISADLLARETSDEKWTAAAKRAAGELDGRTSRADFDAALSFRRREAEQGFREAERASAAARRAAAGPESRAAVEKDLAQAKVRLEAASVHMTLVTEEEARLQARAEEDPAEEVLAELARLQRKKRKWEKERAELQERAAKHEARLLELAAAPSGPSAADETEARLEAARKRLLSADADEALLRQWKAAAAFRPEPATPPPSPPPPTLPRKEKPVPAAGPAGPAAMPAAAAPAPPSVRPENLRLKPGENAFLYRVEEGDTLPSVAKKVYGDEARWPAIYEANANQILKGMLEAGQWILVPAP